MGEYQTLYIIWLRLFWTKLRDDLKQLVKVLHNVYHTRLVEHGNKDKIFVGQSPSHFI